LYDLSLDSRNHHAGDKIALEENKQKYGGQGGDRRKHLPVVIEDAAIYVEL